MSAGQAIAAAAALLLAAGALWQRRRLGAERMLLALAAALALGVYASGLLSNLPNVETLLEDLAQALGDWTYLLVGAMAFLETGAFVGLVAPGEFTVILGGVIAGQGEISILPLIGVIWICAVLGDTTSFLIGRRLGRGFLMKHGPKVKITHERFEQVERYFRRHGGKTILVGRFIGLVRALAPFIAGSSGMTYRAFLPYSLVGTGLWSTTFAMLGFVFYRSFHEVAAVAGRATLVFGVLVAIGVGVVYAYRRLRREEERRRLGAWFERQGRRQLLRPIAAVTRPAWRFVLRPVGRFSAPRVRFVLKRLTPGHLGIEFTTALAVAVVGFYVFLLYTETLTDDPGLTPFDRELYDVTSDLRSESAVDVAKVVTDLGATPVVAGLLAVALVLLAVRRHPIELTALLVGALGVYAGVQLAKAGVDRPRPGGALVETTNASYPSGHAAYSTAYVAMAVVAARVLPGLVSRAALVLAAIAVSAVVGLSRVYLHAHYGSDVLGGWALGAGVFGTCAVVALIVSHLRHNPDARAALRRRPAGATERG